MQNFLLKKLLLLVSFFSFTNSWGQAPGGVTGDLRWWLKANVGVYENSATDAAESGDRVRRWDDQSSVGNDATNSNFFTRPFYRTDVINGYPALEFDGIRFIDANSTPGIGDTEDFIVFMVFKQNSYQTDGGLVDDQGTFIIDRPTETEQLISFKVVNTDKYAYQRREDDGDNLGGPVSVTPVNTSSFVIIGYYRNHQGGSAEEGIYIDGRLDVSQAGPTGDMPAPRFRIGRHAQQTDGGLEGYFAEIAVYDDDLSTQDRQLVESYLALKYGITLDPGKDYLFYDEVADDVIVIYPSTGSHSAYVHDIAGIGQDNDSDLDQETSRSQNPGNMVVVSNPDDLDHGNFLIWGHNNGDLNAPNTTDVGGGIDRRLSRVWRVNETGDVGDFTISIDLSAVPGPKSASDIRLLVDTDGTFAGGATQYSVSSSAGDVFTFNNVSITDDDYFTIGTVDEINTPLPVELTSFDVTHEPPIVVATWETASELNNDYFTLERAGEDLNFFEISSQQGAGTSSTPHSYSAIDPNPFAGKSYYRLKQTDYDGAMSYSRIRNIVIDETGDQLTLYPNPNDGTKLNFKMGSSVFQLQQVEVLSSQGISIERRIISQGNLSDYTVELEQRLMPGFYLVRVNYNGRMGGFKLVVP